MSNSVTFFPDDDVVCITRQMVAELKEAAVSAPAGRSRLCLHAGHDAAVQEMVIALRRESYVAPHRHGGREESFHVIEGDLAVLLFDDGGALTRRIRLSATDPGVPFLYRLRRNLWHTAVPLSEVAIVHEAVAGPFQADSTEWAGWAPPPSDHRAGNAFLEQQVLAPLGETGFEQGAVP